jgi:hypothetical protein
VAGLIAIDPDTTLFGWALFEDRLLTATAVAITPHLPYFPVAVDLVCEIPEDRPGTSVRKNDIIALALAAGQIVGNRPCHFRRPSDWKGQIPKAVHHARMRGVMTEGEIHVLNVSLEVTPKTSHPEILDAVALGLTELRRL